MATKKLKLFVWYRNFQILSNRNGLRPSRFYVLKDNIMVMASEVGVYDTEPENVALKVSDLSGITRQNLLKFTRALIDLFH